MKKVKGEIINYTTENFQTRKLLYPVVHFQQKTLPTHASNKPLFPLESALK